MDLQGCRAPLAGCVCIMKKRDYSAAVNWIFPELLSDDIYTHHHPFTVSIISSPPRFLQSTLTDGLTSGSWSELLSGEQLEYSEYWQYFGSTYCEYSQYFRVHYSGYSEYCLYW